MLVRSKARPGAATCRCARWVWWVQGVRGVQGVLESRGGPACAAARRVASRAPAPTATAPTATRTARRAARSARRRSHPLGPSEFHYLKVVSLAVIKSNIDDIMKL